MKSLEDVSSIGCRVEGMVLFFSNLKSVENVVCIEYGYLLELVYSLI